MGSWLLIATIVAAMLLWRVLLKLWPKDPQWSGIVAASFAIAASIRPLLTEPTESLSFRLHLLLIVAMLVAIGVHAARLRKRRT
jgi:hypothetical protein